MKVLAVLFVLAVFTNSAFADSPIGEVYRIRVENKVGGLVQVSMDSGRTFATVGRVTTAANARITGFAASSYTPHGTIAATSVHGLRIKTGQSAMGLGKAQYPLMFSITPAEFAHIPSGYGGHIPRSSGVLTDIHAGHSIFRNQSPYAGSAVYVDRSHTLLPLPEDYIPKIGEVFVIVVSMPGKLPSEVSFENRVGGKAIATYSDGSTSELAQVDKPVAGVGRYDGTTFTGVGAINTNHGGVITISTAPVCAPGTREGGAVETRGGFMIQPYYHAATQGETSPQVMIIGPRDRTKPALEGTPPLFGGCIGLASFPGHPANSCRAQVRIDDGDWEDVPKLVGRIDNAFSPAYLQAYFSRIGKPRTVRTGVTAVRILFPTHDRDLTAADLARESAECTARAVKSGLKPRSGALRLLPGKRVSARSVVDYYIDGVHSYESNDPPYAFEWDSRKWPNGFHSIDVAISTASGSLTSSESRQVLIRN